MEQSFDELANLFPDQARQNAAAAGYCESQARHGVRSVNALGIQRGCDGANTAGAQIEKLRGKGGCSDIDRDAKTVGRSEVERSFVGEDRGIPLSNFEDEISIRDALTGETPSLP
jgi:hypothetical protein